ncbi:MAG: ECF-type sigma factor [Gemmataceae bacterium]
MSEASRLLDMVAQGDPLAASELLPIVYDEMRRQAAMQMARETPGQTLNPTALVHEAYLRLIGPMDSARWENKRHFLAAAAEAMRRILVENARKKQSLKRGGKLVRHDIDQMAVATFECDDNLPAISEALDELAAHDSDKAELVKLRFFTGLTIEQAAIVLGISTTTESLLGLRTGVAVRSSRPTFRVG